MHPLNIDQWQNLAKTDSETWFKAIESSLSDCIRATGTSVISARSPQLDLTKNQRLSGVPYGLKDLFDYKGLPTHASSILPSLLESRSSRDSAIVQHMQRLGATCAAKTQMNEFAYGLSGENPHYGDCPHPRMPGCLSGGSSSGSAYAVAAGHLPLAFGTDTGGSIRLPSAWCGIYGIRWEPGYFMDGALPLAESFDTIGWFTRTPDDMKMSLRAWFELDETPPTKPISGAAFLPREWVSPETHNALSRFTEQIGLSGNEDFARLQSLLVPSQLAFNILQSREAYGLHKDWLLEYGDAYDPVVKQRILRGKHWSETEIKTAYETFATVRNWFETYFETHDFLAMPICPGPSIPVSEATPNLREQTLQLTTPASLAGLPALSVPVWLDSERSVGIQFIFKDVAPSVPLALLDLCKHI